MKDHYRADGYFNSEAYEDIYDIMDEVVSKKENFSEAVDELVQQLLGKEAKWSLIKTMMFHHPEDDIECSVKHGKKTYILKFFTNTDRFVQAMVATHAENLNSEKTLKVAKALEIGKLVFRNVPFSFIMCESKKGTVLTTLFENVGNFSADNQRIPKFKKLTKAMQGYATSLSNYHNKMKVELDKGIVMGHMMLQINELEKSVLNYAPIPVREKFYQNYFPALFTLLANISLDQHIGVHSVGNINFNHVSSERKTIHLSNQDALANDFYNNKKFFTSPYKSTASSKAEIQKQGMIYGLSGEEKKLLVDVFEDHYKFMVPETLEDEELIKFQKAISHLNSWMTFYITEKEPKGIDQIYAWYEKEAETLLLIKKS